MFGKDIDIKEFTNNLFNLYTLYQSYAWENDKLKIKIEIDERILNISLYKDNRMIDYLNILFNESELQKYNFISLLFVTKILEKRVIHYNSENNTFTNSKQLPYLIILVTNLVTQIGLNLALNLDAHFNGRQPIMIIFYVFIELAIILVEGIVYQIFLKRKNNGFNFGFLYSIIANVVSFVLGMMLWLFY